MLLRSLPESCSFNIYNFGSNYNRIFQIGSEAYSEETFDMAMKMNSVRKADLGGTNLYEPLKAILSSAPLPGHSRQIFLLTDGAVRSL